MYYLIVSILLFELNLVTEFHDFFMFNTKLLCLNSTGFPYWFDSIGLSLFGDLNKLSLIPSSLFCIVIYTPMSIWKTVKDASNHISTNMIG